MILWIEMSLSPSMLIILHCYKNFYRGENGVFSQKNLGRLWLAYTELQGDFTCYKSYLLTLGTLHSQNSAYGGPIYMK